MLPYRTCYVMAIACLFLGLQELPLLSGSERLGLKVKQHTDRCWLVVQVCGSPKLVGQYSVIEEILICHLH